MSFLGYQFDAEQLKVPLGFIKIIQIPLLLIGYTALHGWRFDLRVVCNNTTNKHIYETSSFSLNDIRFKNCADTPVQLFDESFGFSAGFYGFLAIASIFFCLAMLFIYVYRFDAYVGDDRLPRIDTGLTILAAMFWFIMFWVWWRASSNMDYMTSQENVDKLSKEKHFCLEKDGCALKSYSMYAPVTVSVLAALGCAICFAYNIWITYKETVWFRQRQMNQQPHTLEPHSLA